MFSSFQIRLVLVLALLGVPAARTALAFPVFETATLAPDAISPNGDDVQDFTVIDYTVAVDSADVRILVSVAGGGSVVDTLQAFTRQGRGPHTVVFDGTIDAGQIPDGSYEVKILGVGSQGEGTETATLPLLVDRVPPDILDWDVSSPGPVVQDGTTLTMQACVDGADTLAVDFSAIDSEFDPANVTQAAFPPNCTRFTYTISTANTLPDASLLPLVVTATDRAGNRSSAERAMCLSNFPPGVVSSALLNASPFLQNGDVIQTEIEFSSPNTLTVTGDFTGIDSGFDPGNLIVVPRGGQRFEVQYRISDTNTRPDGEYTVRLIGRDQGCGVVEDTSITVTLDNAGINSSLIENVFVDPAGFTPAGNGHTEVTFHFTVDEDSLTVSIATNAQLRNPDRTENIIILFPQTFLRGDYQVDWDGSGVSSQTPDRLIEQNLEVVVRAVSLAKDRERNVEVDLAVDFTPPRLLAFPPPKSLVFTNGDITEIPLTWDGDGYDIDADFSQIDSNFDPGQVVVTPEGGGGYTVFYPVSATNTRPDTVNAPVILTAVDVAGNTSAPLTVVRGCVNHLPPVRVSSALLGKQGPFRNGDRILLEMVWSTEPHQAPPKVTADFSSVDDRWDAVTRPGTVVEVSPGTFQISYTISPANDADDGVGLPIVVTAADDSSKGCGSTSVVAATVELDNQSGTQPTFISPRQDTVVVSTSVILRGIAPGAVLAEVTRNGTAVDTLDVNAIDERFSGAVGLQSGDNRFQVRSIDSAGNLSPPSRIVNVLSVQTTTVTIPGRFSPGNEFFVALLEPSDRVVVRIFNLEGSEIQRLDSRVSARNIHEIPWDGRNVRGDLSTSGPCIAVVEVHNGDGRIREQVRKAFVFTRRGVEP